MFILILGIIFFKIFINPSIFEKPYIFTDTQLSPTPVTDKKGIECIKSGGDWITGPFGKEFFCNDKMADGEKICKSNLDCLSDTCIVNESDDIGKCATHQAVFGCYKFIKSVGRIESICVD